MLKSMPRPRRQADPPTAAVGPLRIIGGTLRGSTLEYSGDIRTRPMKERVRESTFNLLGPAPKGKHAIDLFAGTGALGLEAISRGSVRATMIERHFPSAKLIEKNAAKLKIDGQCKVVGGDAFYWGPRVETDGVTPLLVFCSPPYEFYHKRTAEMLKLIGQLIDLAPPESVFVVEGDIEFDAAQLPLADDWRVREYPPAKICLWRKEAPPLPESGLV